MSCQDLPEADLFLVLEFALEAIVCDFHSNADFALAMGNIRKTITISRQQDAWIKSQIAAGKFTNDSEYIRDLIRRDQSSAAGIEEIRAALIEGESSGNSEPFNPEQFKREMMEKYGDGTA